MIKKLSEILKYFKLIKYEYSSNELDRLYDERLCDSSHVFIIEFIALIIEASNLNYNVFHIKTQASYSIKIPKEDINFMQSDFFKMREPGNTDKKVDENWEAFEKSNLEYKYDSSTLILKDLISDDLYQIFNWGYINKFELNFDNNIGLFISIPNFNNEKINFDFIIISKKNFDINLFWTTKFKTFNIVSINPVYEFTYKFEFYEKLFNVYDFHFLNNFCTLKNPTDFIKDDQIDIESEKKQLEILDKEWDDLVSERGKLKRPFYDYEISQISLKIDKVNENIAELTDLIFEKKLNALDVRLATKIYFSTICFQYHVFNEDTIKNWYCFTNFFELAGAVAIESADIDTITDKFLQPCGVEDITSAYLNNFFTINPHWFFFKTGLMSNKKIFLKKKLIYQNNSN